MIAQKSFANLYAPFVLDLSWKLIHYLFFSKMKWSMLIPYVMWSSKMSRNLQIWILRCSQLKGHISSVFYCFAKPSTACVCRTNLLIFMESFLVVLYFDIPYWFFYNVSTAQSSGGTAPPTPKLACFVFHLKSINTFLKNNVCIL